MNKRKQIYLKFGILLFGISLILTNCHYDEIDLQQNESNQSDLKFNRITLTELNSKSNIKEKLKNLSKSFDVNKNNKVDANDGSFTILTDDIIQILTDSTETYSFLIETPVDSTSIFENFIIDIKDNQTFDFYIYKYQVDENNMDEFPYIFTRQNISQSQIDINDFSTYFNKMDGECFIKWMANVLLNGV